MIEIYQRKSGNVERVGQLEDGEYTGVDSLSYISEWDEERVLQSLDGPYTFATRSEEKSMVWGSLFEKAEWEPYAGPQGGTGWRNPETGEIVYDDLPPGEVELPQELVEEGLGLDVDVDLEDVSEDDVLLAVEDGEVVAVEANQLSADSEWFGVLEDSDVPSPEPEFNIDENLAQVSPDNFDQIDTGVEISFVRDGELTEGWVAENNPEINTLQVETEDGIEPITYTDEQLEEVYVEDGVSPQESVDSILNDIETSIENGEQLPDSNGPQLVEDIQEHYDMPDDEEFDFNPDDADIDNILTDMLALVPDLTEEDFEDYGWETVGDFLRDHPDDVMAGDVFDVMVVSDAVFGPDDYQIEDGEFSYSNADQVPEGETVSIETNTGDIIEGEVTHNKEQDDLMYIETPDGSTKTVNQFEVLQGEVVDPDDIRVGEMPDDPSVDTVRRLLREKGFEETHGKLSASRRESLGNTLSEALEKGADEYEMGTVLMEFTDGNTGGRRVCEQMMKGITVESDLLGEEVPLANDKQIQGEIKKLVKQFEDEYPEYQYYTEDIQEMIDKWTGGSQSSATAPMWAVAFEDGEDNIPENIAELIDREDDETKLDAIREFSNFTQDIVREMFGDEVQLFRGVAGSYGRDRARSATTYGETEVDHRAIASWSVNPFAAEKFAYGSGVVASQTMDVEDIMVGFSNGAGFDYEMEMVASGGNEEYEYVEDAEDFEEGTVVRGNDLQKQEYAAKFFEQYKDFADN